MSEWSAAKSERRTHEEGFTGGFSPWTVAITVTLATFMEVLDTAIANVSLPHIAGSLSVGQDESTWVLTSYLMSNAIILPVSGWLATRFGRKRFYMTCVALFTISSFLCGIAPNLGMEHFIGPIIILEQGRQWLPGGLAYFPFKTLPVSGHQALLNEIKHGVAFDRFELGIQCH